MWIALGIALAVGWLLLRVVAGIASFAVHFLLGAAVLAVVVYFVRGYFGRRDAPAT
jgi:multisubunit Na+/H+ antiporter MnhE subunit